MRTIQISPRLPDVAVIGLGAGPYGSTISRDDAFALMDRFREGGGVMIDTAHIYAAWAPGGAGASERTVGDWSRDRGVDDEMVIATKIGHYAFEAPEAGPRLSPDQMREDLAESLERLGADHVDLLWLHRDDPSRPADEILGVLNAFHEEGLVRAIGASNWSPARLEEATQVSARNHWPAFEASQVGLSLARRGPDPDAPPGVRFADDEDRLYHKQTALPLVAFSAQAKGFFSDKYTTEDLRRDPPGKLRPYVTEENLARRERAFELAETRGISANQIALSWLTTQPFPAVALVGPRTIEQLDDSLAAGDVIY